MTRTTSGRGNRRKRERSSNLLARLRRVSPKHAAVFALLVVFLALTLAVPVRTYLTQRSEFHRLKQENAELVQQAAMYKEKISKQKDPAYIEAQARKRLLYVKRGEKQIVVIDPGRQQREAAARAEREHESNPWYQNMWDAVATPPEGK